MSNSGWSFFRPYPDFVSDSSGYNQNTCDDNGGCCYTCCNTWISWPLITFLLGIAMLLLLLWMTTYAIQSNGFDSAPLYAQYNRAVQFHQELPRRNIPIEVIAPLPRAVLPTAFNPALLPTPVLPVAPRSFDMADLFKETAVVVDNPSYASNVGDAELLCTAGWPFCTTQYAFLGASNVLGQSRRVLLRDCPTPGAARCSTTAPSGLALAPGRGVCVCA